MGLLSKWGLTGQFAKTREETETRRLPRARAVLPGADQRLVTTWVAHPFTSLTFSDALGKLLCRKPWPFTSFTCYFGATLPVPSTLKAARGIGTMQRKPSSATRAEGCWGAETPQDGHPHLLQSPSPGKGCSIDLVPAPAGQTARMQNTQEHPCMCLFKISGSRGQRLLRFYTASPI